MGRGQMMDKVKSVIARDPLRDIQPDEDKEYMRNPGDHFQRSPSEPNHNTLQVYYYLAVETPPDDAFTPLSVKPIKINEMPDFRRSHQYTKDPERGGYICEVKIEKSSDNAWTVQVFPDRRGVSWELKEASSQYAAQKKALQMARSLTRKRAYAYGG